MKTWIPIIAQMSSVKDIHFSHYSRTGRCKHFSVRKKGDWSDTPTCIFLKNTIHIFKKYSCINLDKQGSQTSVNLENLNHLVNNISNVSTIKFMNRKDSLHSKVLKELKYFKLLGKIHGFSEQIPLTRVVYATWF